MCDCHRVCIGLFRPGVFFYACLQSLYYIHRTALFIIFEILLLNTCTSLWWLLILQLCQWLSQPCFLSHTLHSGPLCYVFVVLNDCYFSSVANKTLECILCILASLFCVMLSKQEIFVFLLSKTYFSFFSIMTLYSLLLLGPCNCHLLLNVLFLTVLSSFLLIIVMSSTHPTWICHLE